MLRQAVEMTLLPTTTTNMYVSPFGCLLSLSSSVWLFSDALFCLSQGAAPYCRPDDDDALAANDWSGAWSHSNPVEGEAGVYTFEISRTLTTASTTSDAQMAPGNTYDFGIAWWDPFETEFGWTAAGHYLTGCSADVSTMNVDLL